MDMSSSGNEPADRVFTVERILRRRQRKGKTEFLVKWKGYSTKHNSWEPEDNILDHALIDIFTGGRKGRPGVKLDISECVESCSGVNKNKKRRHVVIDDSSSSASSPENSGDDDDEPLSVQASNSASSDQHSFSEKSIDKSPIKRSKRAKSPTSDSQLIDKTDRKNASRLESDHSEDEEELGCGVHDQAKVGSGQLAQGETGPKIMDEEEVSTDDATGRMKSSDCGVEGEAVGEKLGGNDNNGVKRKRHANNKKNDLEILKQYQHRRLRARTSSTPITCADKGNASKVESPTGPAKDDSCAIFEPPKLQVMVSDSELWFINERNHKHKKESESDETLDGEEPDPIVQLSSKKDAGKAGVKKISAKTEAEDPRVHVVVTDVKAGEYSVVITECYQPHGFFKKSA